MYHRARAHALRNLSGITVYGPPRGGWRRDDPGDDGNPTHGGTGADGGTDDGGKPADDPATDPAKTPAIKGDLDPDRAARSIAAARDAEKKAKDRAAAADKAKQDLIDSIGMALGLKPDPKADPAALAAQAAKELTDTRAELAALKVENALMRVAGKAGGDADALRDSRTFMKNLDGLDPTAKDFEDQVAAAVKDAVKANPKLAVATPGGQGPARQGVDHSGGGNGRQRPTSLGAAIAARMSGT